MSRFVEYVSRVAGCVSGQTGRTDPALRAIVRLRVQSLVTDPQSPVASGLPEALDQYIETVGRHAYKVTDGQVLALRSAGYSEDAIFDVTVTAAVAAGLTRLDRAMALLGKR